MSSTHVDEAFLSHYQFSHDPFAARTPGFKFFPAQRKPLLGQLHHLARYSQLLLVVSGPQGSGKTLLRQALVASSNKQTVLSVVVSAKVSVSVDSVLRQIALGLGLARFDEQSILARVEEHMATGQEVYLLVDDADLLETDALDALLALAEGSSMGRPHVFLFGKPELVSRLQTLSEGEERFHALPLKPYTLEETRGYLALRLEGAGGDLELFNEETIERIHRQSAGWPGAINQVAREVLEEGMLARSRETAGPARSAGLPKRHLLALGVVSLAVAAAWFMRSGADHPAPEGGAVPGMAAPAAGQEEPAIEFAGNPGASAAPAPEDVQPVIREPLAMAAGVEDDEDIGVAGPAIVQSAAATAGAAVASLAAPEPVQSQTGRQAEEPESEVLPAAVSAPAAQPSPVAEPVSRPLVETAPEPVRVPEPEPEPEPEPVIEPVSRPASESSPRPVPEQGGTPDDWYSSQSAGRYSLQVLGTHSESSAQSFVRTQGAGYRYFRKLHQGKPFFVVTYGSFASRTEAQAAIKGLPAKVQAARPWPRSFASIQQEAVQLR